MRHRVWGDLAMTAALAGLRIVEFTAGMAGPWIGRFMAYCGAEVIKVESNKRPDVTRQYAAVGPGDGRADAAVAVADRLECREALGIDLRDCAVGKVCTIVADGANDDNGFDAANISGVVLDGPQSGLTLFQVKGIPDCRYWPKATGETVTATQQICFGSDPLKPTPTVIRCDAAGSVADVTKCPDAKDQYLDIAPLLPEEVKSQFTTAVLPQLLISPRYRGQDANRNLKADPANYTYAPTINLFFGIGEPGLQFRETFRMSFDVGDLTDEVKWGCGGGTSARPDLGVGRGGWGQGREPRSLVLPPQIGFTPSPPSKTGRVCLPGP